MANPNTEIALRTLCDWVAAHPRCTRGEIHAGLQLQNEVSNSTVYRWLDLGISRGLLRRSGNTSGATYEATDQLRIEMLRKHLATDHNKRPRVGYNVDWLDEYEPNKSTYLRSSDLARLQARCPVGSAPLSQLNEHDVSMFMCDLSYSSSHLEGNAYDLASTIQLAEHHIERNGGSHRDKVMILNHRDAARYIIDATREGNPSFGLNQYVVRGIHAILSHELLKDPMMCGGLRTSHVEVWQSSYIPLDIPDRIADNFAKITEKAALITNPYEQAFFLLVHLPYLQPFEDCNKRTSRVVCNIPLLRGGVTPISWMDITNRPRDYSDAIIAVYEHNDPILLAEVFVDCFLRSTERFSLLHRMKNPDPVAAKYRQEIKASIRARVLENVEVVSPNVAGEDVADFLAYVDVELDALMKNEMLGVRYGLSLDILSAWKDAQCTESSDQGNQEFERLRA